MEEWRDIKGYEGLYQVSNEGRVRSLDRIVTQKTKSGYYITRKYAGKVLKQTPDKDGYGLVSLSDKNRKQKQKRVHILVAQAFIPNPDNKPVVGHLKTLDNGLEDKTANEVCNLAWMTFEENARYGTLLERNSVRMKKEYESGKRNKVWEGKKRPDHAKVVSIPIVEIKEDGTVVEWSSTLECMMALGINSPRLNLAVNGKNRGRGHWYRNSQFYKKSEYEKMLEDLASQQLN